MADRTLSTGELEELLTRSEKSAAQEACQRLVPLGVRTLERICKGRKAPAGAKVSAAKAILEHAEGKPATQRPSLPLDRERGVVVNIISVTGSMERHVIDIEAVADADSRESARRIMEEAEAARVPGVTIASFARGEDEFPPEEVDPDAPW